MRCRVIDTIEHREAWTRHHPGLTGRGDGVLAVVDPADLADPHGIAERLVVVHRPDGTRIELRVDLAEAPAGVLGLFFRGMGSVDVPRCSVIEW